MSQGKLYLVSTPIGNLEDITLRAIRILKEVDVIACEDTRRALILLNRYNIKKSLISFFSYNQVKKTSKILELLKNGKNIALISDSGTPGISDPASYLVAECLKNHIDVSPIPGPVAFISSLVCSGLPTDKFIFLGFLPRKKGKMKRTFLELVGSEKTIIFYESAYRVLNTLKIAKEIFGDVDCVIAREITKKFEEFIRGKISEIIEKLEKRKVLGEIVVMFRPLEMKSTTKLCF